MVTVSFPANALTVTFFVISITSAFLVPFLLIIGFAMTLLSLCCETNYTKNCKTLEKLDFGKSSGSRTNYQQYQSQQGQRGTRGVYTSYSNLANNTADIIKDVQYFNKNIVIEPVQKGKYNVQNISIKGSKTGYEVNKASSRISDRRPWEIDAKNGEDVFSGRVSDDSEIISEDLLKKIPGIDENTKFYHKEITITPVVVPPPNFSQK